jgi:hypothetical protein
MSTIRLANWVLSRFVYERRGAVDLEHLYPRAGLEGVVLVVRAGAPYLARQPHGTAVAVHAVDHDRGGADQRRGAGAQLRRHVQVTAGDRPQHQEGPGRHDSEHDPLERDAAAGKGDDRCRDRRKCDRPHEEADRQHLAHGEHSGGDHPQHPLVHRNRS